jgi:hypothetical protein
LKIRIRGAVVQKTADLPRWTLDYESQLFFLCITAFLRLGTCFSLRTYSTDMNI